MAENGTPWTMRLVINSLKRTWPGVANITTAQLAQDLEKAKHIGTPEAEKLGTTHDTGEVLLLDVRPQEEYDVSHIEGALMVDASSGDVPETAKLVQEKNISKVVCYCSLGYRSCKYARLLGNLLKEQGIKADLPVYNLEGSLIKWANEARPMVLNSGARTIYCHPFSAVWGKLLKSSLRRSTPE